MEKVEIIKKLAGLFNSYILVMILLIGAYTLFVDVTKLKKREYIREMKIAKYISYFYIFGGLITFIAINIFM